MSPTAKRVTLIFLAASLLSVILLTSSLSNLQLQAGAPFPGGGNSGAGNQPGTDLAPAESRFLPGLSEIFNLVLLVFVIYVAVRLIVLLDLKRVSQLLLVVIILLVIANVLSRLPGGQPVYVSGESSAATQPASEYAVSVLGEPPQGLLRLVLFLFVFGLGLLAVKLLKLGSSPTKIEDRLSREAESAVHAIKLGQDLRNVILRCYLQMTQILQEEQGIERSASMTVREFEENLEQKGFPAAAVHQISNLFEKVRYGHQGTLSEDERVAVESLNEIIMFCRNGSK